MKAYGVYVGSIHEGGGVYGTLFLSKEGAIKECIKRYKAYQRVDRKYLKYDLEHEKDPDSLKYNIQHAKQYKWRKHKTIEHYWYNTVDCISLQEFEITE